MSKSGKRTMLWSVIMSSPGPLVVGLGLIAGKSSTQIADFIRRSIELSAIILSFIIYCVTTKDESVDEVRKQRLEKIANIFVSVAMITSGIIMAVLCFFNGNTEKGNVIPGLVIALLGVIANSIFWFRYSSLGRSAQNGILITQSKLYRAKTFVDLSVTVALGVVLFCPNQAVAYYFDLIGTLCVAVYLLLTGITTLIKELKNKTASI